jgi:hypothetical protein
MTVPGGLTGAELEEVRDTVGRPPRRAEAIFSCMTRMASDRKGSRCSLKYHGLGDAARQGKRQGKHKKLCSVTCLQHRRGLVSATVEGDVVGAVRLAVATCTDPSKQGAQSDLTRDGARGSSCPGLWFMPFHGRLLQGRFRLTIEVRKLGRVQRDTKLVGLCRG